MSKPHRQNKRIRPNRHLWNLGHRSKSRHRRFKWIRAIPSQLFLSILVLFLLFEIGTLPFLSLFRLNKENPKETALMQQRIEEARTTGQKLTIEYRWIPLSKISRHLQRAVLIAEDARFYEHAGVDWHEVGESFAANWEQGRIVRGGSTITQQLAKNLYLSTSRDPIRKLRELIVAWMLEATLSKKRILELYLNIIEWGQGIFGVESAAQHYFHKAAEQLSKEEAARLATVIPSPLRHKPNDLTPLLEKKKEVILQRMSTR